MPNEYKNPYIVDDDVKVIKLNATIPYSEFAFLKGIRLAGGTVQTTINLLIAKLINELRQRHITSITDAERFEHFVANSVLTLPGEWDSKIESDIAGSAGDNVSRRPSEAVVFSAPGNPLAGTTPNKGGRVADSRHKRTNAS